MNDELGVPHISILPKPKAHFMFVGRDPSPRTATMVGVQGGRSVFIDEIFSMADSAGVAEDHLYITDLCKCHWRTSVGTPWPNTEQRSAKLDVTIAQTCLNQWLLQEIAILIPRLMIAFGEEVYQLLRPYVTDPSPVPPKLSARADKSVLDAEYWLVTNGPFTLTIGDAVLPVAFLRHPGNARRLPRGGGSDQRRHFHQAARQQVIQLLREASR